ncbi:MAG: hypothetical protein Q7U34_11410 [Anaerolineales bacterium]|nr:hypothetical protein [Anaerolineales bacterium]
MPGAVFGSVRRIERQGQLTFKHHSGREVTWQEPRILSKNLTLQFQKVVYQIQTKRPSYAMRHATVMVCLDAQNNVTILYKGQSHDYTIFHKQSKQSDVVQTKQIDLALMNQSKAHKPAPDHPWRTPSRLWKTGDISTLG